jgi:hypothetical protein
METNKCALCINTPDEQKNKVNMSKEDCGEALEYSTKAH